MGGLGTEVGAGSVGTREVIWGNRSLEEKGRGSGVLRVPHKSWCPAGVKAHVGKGRPAAVSEEPAALIERVNERWFINRRRLKGCGEGSPCP